MKFTVEVVEYASSNVVHRIPCNGSKRDAEKTESGVNRNLNHEKFYTRISEAFTRGVEVGMDRKAREIKTCLGIV